LLEKCGITELLTLVGWAAHCWVLRGQPVSRLFGVWGLLLVSRGDRSPASLCRGLSVAVRVVVENCTVDASIFCFCAHLCRDFLMCVLVKLLRAHGGCLGIRSR
jgi:hypothetical protein